jgi:hypothetical protein
MRCSLLLGGACFCDRMRKWGRCVQICLTSFTSTDFCARRGPSLPSFPWPAKDYDQPDSRQLTSAHDKAPNSRAFCSQLRICTSSFMSTAFPAVSSSMRALHTPSGLGYSSIICAAARGFLRPLQVCVSNLQRTCRAALGSPRAPHTQNVRHYLQMFCSFSWICLPTLPVDWGSAWPHKPSTTASALPAVDAHSVLFCTD